MSNARSYPEEIYRDIDGRVLVSAVERRLVEKAYTCGYLSGGYDEQDVEAAYEDGFAAGRESSLSQSP